ncbi:hypothetical protein FNV43_RR19391 [Rhamnella rubrinervis]|uniref:Uncharacterized protein n=1 Tax=Rhamnella rubrinervis TaxID=2594499 RepID=A0A8K0GW82_9ROSA|nr:hypothetical protein FNV43_RR19391 [Rhamnella rubrinervis]
MLNTLHSETMLKTSMEIMPKTSPKTTSKATPETTLEYNYVKPIVTLKPLQDKFDLMVEPLDIVDLSTDSTI